MNKNCVLLFLFVVVLFYFDNALGQSKADPLPSAEVVALKAQIEVMQGYQEQFIEVVLWSLGVVVTMVFGMLAFSWYSNKANYERDRDFLRQERDVLRNELISNVGEELNKISGSLPALISESQAPISQKIEENVSSKISSFVSKIENLKYELFELKYKDVERDADQAVKAKSFNWALRKYCEMLDLSAKRDAGYEIPNTIDSIKLVLQQEGLKLYADDVSLLVETLGRLPSKYRITSEKLIEMVKSRQ